MADKKLTFDIDSPAGKRNLRELNELATQLEQTLMRIGGTLGTGGAAPDANRQFMGALSQLNATRSAISSIEGSTASGGEVAGLVKRGMASTMSAFTSSASIQNNSATLLGSAEQFLFQPGYTALAKSMALEPDSLTVGRDSQGRYLDKIMSTAQMAQMGPNSEWSVARGVYNQNAYAFSPGVPGQEYTRARQYAGNDAYEAQRGKYTPYAFMDEAENLMERQRQREMGDDFIAQGRKYVPHAIMNDAENFVERGRQRSMGYDFEDAKRSGKYVPYAMMNEASERSAAMGPSSAWNPEIGRARSNAFQLQHDAFYNTAATTTEQDFWGAQNKSFLHTFPQSYMGRFSKGALLAIGESASAWGGAEVSERLSGRPDIMAKGGSTGGLIGGVIGGAVGSIFPGYGSLVGAGVGYQAGSAIGQFLNAGDQAKILRQMSLANIGALSGSFNQDYGHVAGPGDPRNPLSGYNWVNPGASGAARLAGLSDSRAQAIGQGYWQQYRPDGTVDTGGYKKYYETPEQLSQGYATAYSALVAGGINPEQQVTQPLTPTLSDSRNKAIQASGHATVAAGGLMNVLMGTGVAAVGTVLPKALNYGTTSTDLYKFLNENAAARYGSAGLDNLKSISGVIGSLNETGGNWLDILRRFGPETTQHASEIFTPMGQTPPTNLKDLMAATAAGQKAQRAMQFAALNVRDVGFQQDMAISHEMVALRDMPGYEHSMTARELNAEQMAGRFREYSDVGRTNFDIPMAHVQGAIERSNVLPFNPSNRYGLEMRSISMAQQEVQRTQQFMGKMRAAGQLSEDAEFELTRKIESLKTSEAEGVAKLSDGLDDRLPGLSAGRPNSFRRFDSFQLAAMSLMRQGSPIRSYGALNGAQRQMQEDFTLSFGAGNTGPYDRTMQMDNHAVVGGMQNLVGALNNLASKMGGGTTLGAGTTVNNNSAGGGNNNRPQGNNGGNSQPTSTTTPDQQRTYISGQVQTQQQYLLPNNTNGRAQGYN